MSPCDLYIYPQHPCRLTRPPYHHQYHHLNALPDIRAVLPPKNPSALAQLNSTGKPFDSGHPQRSIQSRSTCSYILKCGCGGVPRILISEGRGLYCSPPGRQLFLARPTKGLVRWLPHPCSIYERRERRPISTISGARFLLETA